jgi:hypothetical protein
MLAFEKVTDKDIHIANIYADEKSKKVVQKIWYTHKHSGDSEIVNDNLIELLAEEQLSIMKDTNITLEEYKRLCSDLKSTKPVNPDYTRSLKKAYTLMREMIGQKLRRELTLSRMDPHFIRYNYDTRKRNTAQHRLYCGTSGSGKSWALVRQTLDNPDLFHITKFTLIGTTGEGDPSYQPLKDYFGARFDYINSEEITAEQCQVAYYPRCSMICFDDTTSTVDRKRRAAVQELSDRLLTTARHRSINLTVVIHRFNSYRQTSKVRNSSSTWHLFPRTIPSTLLQILDKNFGWKKRKREDLLRRVQFDGRQTTIRVDFPQLLLTPKRIVLL